MARNDRSLRWSRRACAHGVRLPAPQRACGVPAAALSVVRHSRTLCSRTCTHPEFYILYTIVLAHLQESFEKAQKWVDELKRSGGVRMVLAMAGNKLDLAEQRQVPQEKALAYAEENGIFFIETSAKTSQNVRGIVLFLSFPFLSFHDKRMHFRETRAVEP